MIMNSNLHIYDGVGCLGVQLCVVHLVLIGGRLCGYIEEVK